MSKRRIKQLLNFINSPDTEKFDLKEKELFFLSRNGFVNEYNSKIKKRKLKKYLGDM